MLPAHPPLPTAWNLPFHFVSGIQTSISMCESAVGVSTAATRQCPGTASAAVIRDIRQCERRSCSQGSAQTPFRKSQKNPANLDRPAPYFSSASTAACEIASSTSDAAPLHATAPMVCPSTFTGTPPWFGKPSGATN